MHNLVGDKIKALLKDAGKSIAELGVRTDTHAGYWSQVINGTKRLSVDLAIKLGKVFPIERVTEESPIIEPSAYWLSLQYRSDVKNAVSLDGPMYRKIKPFGDDK